MMSELFVTPKVQFNTKTLKRDKAYRIVNLRTGDIFDALLSGVEGDVARFIVTENQPPQCIWRYTRKVKITAQEVQDEDCLILPLVIREVDSDDDTHSE